MAASCTQELALHGPTAVATCERVDTAIAKALQEQSSGDLGKVLSMARSVLQHGSQVDRQYRKHLAGEVAQWRAATEQELLKEVIAACPMLHTLSHSFSFFRSRFSPTLQWLSPKHLAGSPEGSLQSLAAVGWAKLSPTTGSRSMQRFCIASALSS